MTQKLKAVQVVSPALSLKKNEDLGTFLMEERLSNLAFLLEGANRENDAEIELVNDQRKRRWPA